jgi:hypothetical protein
MYYQAIFLFQVTHGNDLIRFDWLGLWCLMSLSTIFQLYHGGQLPMVVQKIPYFRNYDLYIPPHERVPIFVD